MTLDLYGPDAQVIVENDESNGVQDKNAFKEDYKIINEELNSKNAKLNKLINLIFNFYQIYLK